MNWLLVASLLFNTLGFLLTNNLVNERFAIVSAVLLLVVLATEEET